MLKKRILFCCNTLHGFCDFRLDIVKFLVSKGNEAIVVYPDKDGVEQSLATLPLGCKAVPCRMLPNGTSVIQDSWLLYQLLCIFKKEKPDIIFNYTIKPNIYGGFAANFLKIPSVAVVPGLGYVFAKTGVVTSMIRGFYVLGLQKAKRVLVLNSSDQKILIEEGVEREKLKLLEGGEGVELSRYPFFNGVFKSPRFLMITRLLYDKGSKEFVNVSERIRRDYPDVRYEIAGSINEQTPSGVPRSVVKGDERLGKYKYLGYVDDIAAEMADPDTVVVLPSYYREGMNRSLMEACSCGRPIITTDMPGLKEMVIDRENGFLVRPHDEESLYAAISSFLALTIEQRRRMCYKSRELAEKRFSVEFVKNEYLRIIEQIFEE